MVQAADYIGSPHSVRPKANGAGTMSQIDVHRVTASTFAVAWNPI
ncbi:MAG: hypothetical protein ABSC94_28430 [Polyangiaceae bacterium]